LQELKDASPPPRGLPSSEGVSGDCAARRERRKKVPMQGEVSLTGDGETGPARLRVCLPLDGSGKAGKVPLSNRDETTAGVSYQLVSRRLIKRPGCRKTLSRVTPAIG